MQYGLATLKYHIESRIQPCWQRLPVQEQYRHGIYWSIVTLSVLVLGFTVFHVQSIPATISRNIEVALDRRLWVNDLVVVDGQHIYLTGEVEPESGLVSAMTIIEAVPGVKSVTSRLNEILKPPAYLQVVRSGEDVALFGELNGETLEKVITAVEAGFVQPDINDQIRIDDRMGRPLWLEGFGQSLSVLSELNEFEFNGWRDQIEISGEVGSDLERRRTGYTLPALMAEEVRVINRLRQKVTGPFASITILSDWNGTYVGGTVPSEEIRQHLLASARQAFGLKEVESDFIVDDSQGGEQQLKNLGRLLVEMGEVRDMRLQSTQDGYVVWGRVDNAGQLGEILYTQYQLGLLGVVRNKIVVAQADKPAFLSLFSDRRQAIINGVLPTTKVRQRLIEAIQKILGVGHIMDLTSIEPNIAQSEWLSKWSGLLSVMPEGAIGLSINDKSVMVTGHAGTEQEFDYLDQRLSGLFPHIRMLNWTTATRQ